MVAVDIYNFSELLSFIFIFLVIFIFVVKAHKFFEVSKTEILLIYFWHTFFALIFLIIDLNHGHDSSGWYTNGERTYQGGYYGNDFMYLISGILLKKIMIFYVAQNLIFNLFGALTIIMLYSILKKLCKSNINKIFFPYFVIFLFLPGFSFWTSGISKDVISIFGMTLLYFSIVSNLNKKLFFTSILLIFFSRPFLIPFFAFGVYIFLFLKYFLNKKFNNIKKFFILILFTILIFPFILFANIGSEYMSVHNFTFNPFDLIQDIFRYIQSSQQYYSDTNLGIPKDTFGPLRYLYFLYMPFVLSFSNVFSIYFILENVYLLFFAILIIFNLKINNSKINSLTKIFYISVLIMFIIFPFTFSNYGIALRYKWLFIPFLFLAFLDFRKKIR